MSFSICCPSCGNPTYSLHYVITKNWETKNYCLPERYCPNCKRLMILEIKEKEKERGV